MTYKPYLIADVKTGLELDREPFLIPNDAFPQLNNAYIWRRRIKKKNGHQILGRLRRDIVTQANANTTGAGTYTSTDILTAFRATEPQAQLVPGSVTFRIDPGGGNQTIYRDNVTSGIMTYVSGPFTISAGTINYFTGIINLTFTVVPGVLTTNVDYGYYPGLPVMGLPTRNLSAINAEQLLAFDTKYAYVYSNSTNRFQELVAGTTWTGSNSQFFWGLNYQIPATTNEYFFETNYNITAGKDPIRYYDGAIWNTFNPAVDGANFLEQTKMLFTYRGRMVALNTWEGANLAGSTQNPQRARWSQNGDATDLVNGWRSDIVGRGGYVDAPTDEHITSAGFLKDILIVFFERSTWKLRYTNNELLPFVWERVNSEFGSEGRFSTVLFDVGPVTVGNRGIVQTDGVNTLRVDNIIPDEVFSFQNENEGPERVQGIRDFDEQVVYWAFPNDNEDGGVFPNRVLLYNYREQSWAVFQDAFTCFGYWQSFADLTWGNATMTWGDADFLWNDPKKQALYPSVVGGNQQGYVLVIQEQTVNDQSLRIEIMTVASPSVITSTNHNLVSGDYVRLENIVGTTEFSTLNGLIFQVFVLTANTLNLLQKPIFPITAITLGTQTTVTAIGNNFAAGDLCQVTYVGGTTQINNITARVVTVGNTFVVDLDSSAFTAYTSGGNAQNLMAPLQFLTITGGTFAGFGEMARVDQFSILSKKFNPVLDMGFSARLGWIDFYVDATGDGKFAVDLYVDDNDSTPVNVIDATNPESNVVETFLNPFETQGATKMWHSLYNQCDANFYQFDINYSEPQMNSIAISSAEVVIHALVVHAEKSSERLT